MKKAKKAPAAKAPAKQAAKGKDAKETKPKPATSRARKAPAKKEASNSKDTAAPKPAPTTIGKKRSADALQSEQPEPQAKKRKVGGKVSGAGPSSNPQEPGKAEIASAAGPRNQPHLNDKTVPQGNTAPPTNGKKPTAKKPAPKAKATANTGKRAHLRRQATMNASSPNNGINGAGSIPLTRSGAPDFARMTVEQALSVPMDFDLPRARNSRPNALDTRSYASVVDTLPSEREMLSADRFAAERDHAAEVSRMDRMRDEAVEKAVRLDLAMMKYQVSLLSSSSSFFSFLFFLPFFSLLGVNDQSVSWGMRLTSLLEGGRGGDGDERGAGETEGEAAHNGSRYRHGRLLWILSEQSESAHWDDEAKSVKNEMDGYNTGHLDIGLAKLLNVASEMGSTAIAGAERRPCQEGWMHCTFTAWLSWLE